MKRGILLVGLLLVLSESMAQDVFNSNQPFQFAPMINPAFSGVESFSSLKLGYRNQWLSFPDAPRIVNLMFDTRIRQPFDASHNALKLGKQVTVDDLPKGKRMIHGLSGGIYYETAGQLEGKGAILNYSLHYPVSKKTYVALGVGANYNNTTLNRLRLREPDRFYDEVQGVPLNNLQVRTGIVLYAPTFYIHASYLSAVEHSFDEGMPEVHKSNYIASGGAGISLPMNNGAFLKPSVYALLDRFNDISFDYNLKLYLREKAWGGVTYRDTGFAVFILGFELNPLVGFSYSYELATGGFRTFSNGSHELVLGLKLGNVKKVNPYIW